MKKILVASMTLPFFATACEKSKTPMPASSPVQTSHSTCKKFVDFNYTLSKNPTTGEYSCPTPKSDCSKITPDPLISLRPIDAAISSGNVQEFFNQDNWAEQFPYLDDQDAVVSGLQNGDYTMVRRTNSSGGILYIVISSDENPASFNTAVYTTLVTNE